MYFYILARLLFVFKQNICRKTKRLSQIFKAVKGKRNAFKIPTGDFGFKNGSYGFRNKAFGLRKLTFITE